MLVITIKQGKEKSLLERQPWIYASAVERVDGRPDERFKPGATAIVNSSSGKFLARAAYSPKSQIRARVWSFDPDEAIDHALIKRRVNAAIARRFNSKTGTADKLTPVILGEEDGLPGLLVDSFGATDGFLICQFQAAGVDAWKVPIVQALMAETGCRNVYERCDALIRKGEGLPVICGALAGDEPPDQVIVSDHGVLYAMDLATGARSKLR